MIKNRFYSAGFGVAAEALVAQFLDASNTTAPQATYNAFIASALAGAVAAYWDDTNAVVAVGATALAANAKRKFFYAWKQADGTVMRTAPIPAAPTYKTVAFAAGTSDVWTLAFGGTISVSQWIHVRIMDTTSKTVPYPSYEYVEKVTSTVNAALVKIAASINAEKNEPIATATVSTTNLTITCTDKNRSIKVLGTVEISAAQQTDASAITVTHDTKGITPLGTYADVKEFEKVYLVKNAAILYTGNHDQNVNVTDFQSQASNVVTGINYGYLVVTARKFEFPQSSVTPFHNKAYIVVAAPAAAITYLATL